MVCAAPNTHTGVTQTYLEKPVFLYPYQCPSICEVMRALSQPQWYHLHAQIIRSPSPLHSHVWLLVYWLSPGTAELWVFPSLLAIHVLTRDVMLYNLNVTMVSLFSPQFSHCNGHLFLLCVGMWHKSTGTGASIISMTAIIELSNLLQAISPKCENLGSTKQKAVSRISFLKELSDHWRKCICLVAVTCQGDSDGAVTAMEEVRDFLSHDRSPL